MQSKKCEKVGASPNFSPSMRNHVKFTWLIVKNPTKAVVTLYAMHEVSPIGPVRLFYKKDKHMRLNNRHTLNEWMLATPQSLSLNSSSITGLVVESTRPIQPPFRAHSDWHCLKLMNNCVLHCRCQALRWTVAVPLTIAHNPVPIRLKWRLLLSLKAPSAVSYLHQFSVSQTMSDNQTSSLELHTFPCGPTTMTIDSLDWVKAKGIHSCGWYEAQKSMSTNGADTISPGSLSKIVTLAVLVLSFVCLWEREIHQCVWKAQTIGDAEKGLIVSVCMLLPNSQCFPSILSREFERMSKVQSLPSLNERSLLF